MLGWLRKVSNLKQIYHDVIETPTSQLDISRYDLEMIDKAIKDLQDFENEWKVKNPKDDRLEFS